ncbi:MAG: glycosyl transferase [Gallionellaceae bacterium]|nr:MAG: glycosyl transferase [Gallionellaceae bacterium]
MYSNRKSIGVVLCTYNGAKYLRQQLESILAQTRQPDQILILDDCSNDCTVPIINNFAALDNRIRLIQNETNLGFARNFEKGIALCEMDFIALSDQDDIWLPEKLERLATELETNPGAGIAYGNAEYMLADGIRTGHMVFPEGNGFTDDPVLARKGILEKKWNVPGNFILLDAEIKKLIIPNPIDRSFAHDIWICLNAFFLRNPRYVPEPISLYRLHKDMTSGAIALVLKGTPYALKKKKWCHPQRLTKNLLRAFLSPFKHRGKIRDRQLRAYNLATDMLSTLEQLLEKRRLLGLPDLSHEEHLFLQKKREEWASILASSPDWINAEKSKLKARS